MNNYIHKDNLDNETVIVNDDNKVQSFPLPAKFKNGEAWHGYQDFGSHYRMWGYKYFGKSMQPGETKTFTLDLKNDSGCPEAPDINKMFDIAVVPYPRTGNTNCTWSFNWVLQSGGILAIRLTRTDVNTNESGATDVYVAMSLKK